MTDHRSPTTDHSRIRLDHFMSDALTRYYGSRDPLGVNGDFITAPEISQMFGEMIGIWAVQQWMRMGSPARFNLIELGPGRGTLMADLLRGTQHVPGFHAAMSVHMVEMSEALKNKQMQTLHHCTQPQATKQSNGHKTQSLDCGLRRNDGIEVQWHSHLSAISTDSPAIIIANEFFDALPVRQFKYDDGEWLEHYINDGQSVYIAMSSPHMRDDRGKKTPFKSTLPPPRNGDIYEYSQAQEDYAKLIATYHGAALIIDYGYACSAYGDTVQALYKHAPCAVTDHVGEADLTTHIDFEWLATFFKTSIIKTQAQFLQENGIAVRYRQLNNPQLHSGYERLIHPDQMGELFKVLEVVL